jgi:hypothetical protein
LIIEIFLSKFKKVKKFQITIRCPFDNFCLSKSNPIKRPKSCPEISLDIALFGHFIYFGIVNILRGISETSSLWKNPYGAGRPIDKR